MDNGLTTHQIGELFRDLQEIKADAKDTSARLAAIERGQTRMEAAISRMAEDRARIKIAEDNVVMVAERVVRVEERQKVGAGVLAGFQVLLAALAAWIGTTK